MSGVQGIEDEGILTQRTRGLRQAFVKMVNDRCEHLENTHDETITRLDGIEVSQAELKGTLDAVLAHLEGLGQAPPPLPMAPLRAAPATTGVSGPRRQNPIADEENNKNNLADTEDGDLNSNDDRAHRRRRFNR